MSFNNTNNVHPHYQNGYHLQHITQIATVEHCDGSHGLFGELLDPAIVLQGLHLSDNVGRLDDPTAAMATQAMHSFLCSTNTQEVVIEFDNTTPHPIVLRWLDEKGLCYPHFQWTLEPFSQKVQYSRLGDLFVLSVRLQGGEEQLLGAYRIRMPLTSGSAHYILIEQDPTADDLNAFHMEEILADKTGQDEIMVACACLDDGSKSTATLQTLSTILGNIQKDPDNAKFRSLRLSNPKVQKTIAFNGGARQLLHSVGFREDKDKEHLVLLENTQDDTTSRLTQVISFLEQLKVRSQPGFVAELAPPVPWQGPVLNSTTTSARSFGSGNGTSFLSDDEKWKRAERNRGRRGGGGRRPSPGSAPSSNGAWGR